MVSECGHPPWCDLNVCRAVAEGTEHGSTRVPVVTGGLMWEVSLYQLDEGCSLGDAPGEVWVRVEVTDMELTGRDGMYDVPFGELPKVTGALSCLYTWGLFCSVPETVRP